MQPSNHSNVIQEKADEIIARDVLAADLRCSFFVSALQSYKRDSVLRPFPSLYTHEDNKDFDSLLADTNVVPNLKELVQSTATKDERLWDLLDWILSSKLLTVNSVKKTEAPKDERLWDLLDWILSSKLLTVNSVKKTEYEKIQELTGFSNTTVPPPDFLFEIVYSEQMNAKFEETKGESDLIYAFHGSRLENFHSILHSGLHCHLNKTSLFGQGTYLTSDLSLALLYSPHGHGWQHSILGPVLSSVAVCEIIDHPDVKCQVKKKDSSEIDRKRARVRNSEAGDVPQKYFVVTNNQLLRVKYLLIYSQKQHRRRTCSSPSWISTHRFAVMMSMYVLLLAIIGISNSPAFLNYWNRLFDWTS